MINCFDMKLARRSSMSFTTLGKREKSPTRIWPARKNVENLFLRGDYVQINRVTSTVS